MKDSIYYKKNSMKNLIRFIPNLEIEELNQINNKSFNDKLNIISLIYTGKPFRYIDFKDLMWLKTEIYGGVSLTLVIAKLLKNYNTIISFMSYCNSQQSFDKTKILLKKKIDIKNIVFFFEEIQNKKYKRTEINIKNKQGYNYERIDISYIDMISDNDILFKCDKECHCFLTDIYFNKNKLNNLGKTNKNFYYSLLNTMFSFKINLKRNFELIKKEKEFDSSKIKFNDSYNDFVKNLFSNKITKFDSFDSYLSSTLRILSN